MDFGFQSSAIAYKPNKKGILTCRSTQVSTQSGLTIYGSSKNSAKGAAATAVSEVARTRAGDLTDYVAQLQADGVTSLRGIADALNANEIETSRGGAWGPSSVRNLLARIEA